MFSICHSQYIRCFELFTSKLTQDTLEMICVLTPILILWMRKLSVMQGKCLVPKPLNLLVVEYGLGPRGMSSVMSLGLQLTG